MEKSQWFMLDNFIVVRQYFHEDQFYICCMESAKGLPFLVYRFDTRRQKEDQQESEEYAYFGPQTIPSQVKTPTDLFEVDDGSQHDQQGMKERMSYYSQKKIIIMLYRKA